jgi:thiamine-phosphate pyrophosphorylase
MERSVYRIIDANFNRSREALRLIEDYCRFALNSLPLTERAKKIRHDLCAAIDRLDGAKLLSGRDTPGDVGAGLSIDNQMKRGSLDDALTAAAKRLTEALRVLGEVIAPLNRTAAEKIESLRYEVYTLEKDVFFSSATSRFNRVRLYVVLSCNLPADVFALTEKCIVGGADCIQLRAKHIDDDALFALADEFVKLCRAGSAISIINDRVDIAVASGADGVHLGQNDLPVEQAYRLAASPLIIGKSTHSIEQLKAACRQPITYAALGPVFATPTKPVAAPVGLEYVTEGTKVLGDAGLGHVVIGGINLENIELVLKAGAKAVAVCRAVTDAPNPQLACQRLKERIVSFRSDD